MTFTVSRAKDYLHNKDTEKQVEINTIEELAELDRKEGSNGLHIDFGEQPPAIVILDDWYE